MALKLESMPAVACKIGEPPFPFPDRVTPYPLGEVEKAIKDDLIVALGPDTTYAVGSEAIVTLWKTKIEDYYQTRENLPLLYQVLSERLVSASSSNKYEVFGRLMIHSLLDAMNSDWKRDSQIENPLGLAEKLCSRAMQQSKNLGIDEPKLTKNNNDLLSLNYRDPRSLDLIEHHVIHALRYKRSDLVENPLKVVPVGKTHLGIRIGMKECPNPALPPRMVVQSGLFNEKNMLVMRGGLRIAANKLATTNNESLLDRRSGRYVNSLQNMAVMIGSLLSDSMLPTEVVDLHDYSVVPIECISPKVDDCKPTLLGTANHRLVGLSRGMFNVSQAETVMRDRNARGLVIGGKEVVSALVDDVASGILSEQAVSEATIRLMGMFCANPNVTRRLIMEYELDRIMPNVHHLIDDFGLIPDSNESLIEAYENPIVEVNGDAVRLAESTVRRMVPIRLRESTNTMPTLSPLGLLAFYMTIGS